MTHKFTPLTRDDIAQVLRVCVRTIDNWVNDGTLLAPKKLGSRSYWHPDLFHRWLDQALNDSEPGTKAASSKSAPGPLVDAALKPKAAKTPTGVKSDIQALRERDEKHLQSMSS